MANITYSIPNYKDNPDIIRDLVAFAESFTDILLTTDDKDEIYSMLQDTTDRLQEYVDGVVGNNAIPILYQCGYGRKAPMFQINRSAQNGANQVLSDIVTISVTSFTGVPISTALPQYIGDYIDYQVSGETKYKLLIIGVKSGTEYTCLVTDEYYDFESYRYTDTGKGISFDFVSESTPSTFNIATGYRGFALEIKDGTANVYFGYYGAAKVWCKIGTFTPKMFSVLFSKGEEKYYMWDGVKLNDFGHTFIPQEETYTKVEIDGQMEMINNEIGRREYSLQSGNNVIIDRSNPENPVLNIQNFSGLPGEDAITSLTAVKNDSIKGYDITLRTLGSGDGFKCQLKNVIFTDVQTELDALEVAVDTIRTETTIDPAVKSYIDGIMGDFDPKSVL